MEHSPDGGAFDESANKELQLHEDELEETVEMSREAVESTRNTEDNPCKQPGEQQHEQPGEQQHDTKRSARTASLREEGSPHHDYDEAKEDWKSVRKKQYVPIKNHAELKRRSEDAKVGDANPANERAHKDDE
jgi:hypothetical protein